MSQRGNDVVYDIELRFLHMHGGKGADEVFLQYRKLIKRPDSEGYLALTWTHWKPVPIVRRAR